MKTAIIYASVHHGNTKKIIDEIAKTNEVDLIENKNIFLMQLNVTLFKYTNEILGV